MNTTGPGLSMDFRAGIGRGKELLRIREPDGYIDRQKDWN